MANEPLALAVESDTPSDDEYQAFCATLATSARGRAFLAEHARRARAADTGMLLNAIDRLETLVHPVAEPAAAAQADSVRDELRGLLDVIRGLQAEIDIGGLAMQVAKLVSLIDVVQQCIEALVAPVPDESIVDEPAAPDAELAALEAELAAAADDIFADILVGEPQAVFAQAEPDIAEAPAEEDVARSDEPVPTVTSPVLTDAPQESALEGLAVEAAPSEQPEELPPAPLDTMPPPAQPDELAFAAQDATPPSEPSEDLAPAPLDTMPQAVEPPAAHSAAMPEVSWDERPASAPESVLTAQPVVPPSAAALAIAAVVEQAAASAAAEAAEAAAITVIKAGTMAMPTPFEGDDFSSATNRVKTIPPADPLMPIMALSDDERTALFT